MPPTRKPIPRDIAPVRRFARLSKNFVVNGDLARVVKQEQLTGRDLHALLALLAEAQKQDKRELTFDSLYTILKLLGWSDRGSDYDALEHALGKWMTIEVSIDRFYVPDNAVTSEMEQEAIEFRFDKRGWPRGCYVSMNFPYSMDFYQVGGDDCISFPETFWEVNSKGRGYFVKAYPTVIKQLRYPPEILLYLLLDAFKGSLRMSPEVLCSKIALTMRSRSWLEGRLGTALARICDATKKDFRLRYDAYDNLIIHQGEYTDQIRSKLYGNSAKRTR